MKALVVYDSVFGNTEKIAQAMGQALPAELGAEVLRVGDVQPAQLTGLDLLLVGSPTRAFRPTPAITKLLGSVQPGMLQGTRVAAFDTRIAPEDIKSVVLRKVVSFMGYADKRIADKLRRAGGAQAIAPEGFFVQDSEGPLKDGELERAGEWARRAATI
jgi:flavodoxin